MDDLKIRDKKNKENLYNVYKESKTLFIDAEEKLPDMKFFPAPTLEHRDALEHVMRYFELTNDNELTDVAEKELELALGHEQRAFFDTADFICINIRKHILKSLEHVPKRKIKKVWGDYWNVKEQVFNLSSEIAMIRKNRKGSMEYIEKYKIQIEKLWEIYNNFELNILKKFKN